MEFLDDLIKKQNTEEQPEQENEPEGNAWDDLLNVVAFEDQLENDAGDQKTGRGLFGRQRKSQKRDQTKKSRIPRRRKRILTLLGISAFLIWGLIFALILRFSGNNVSPGPGKPADQNPTAAVTQDIDSAITPTQSTEEVATELPPAEDLSPGDETASDPSPSKPPIEDAPFTRFDREIQENPKLIDLYQLRGQEYIDKGAYEAALADFEYALALDGNRGEAYAGIGKVYFHMRWWNEAELAFKSALERNAAIPDAHFWLGHIHFYKGEYKAAAKAFDMAAEFDRSYAEAEAWLAIASAQLGDYGEAQGAVTRAMSLTQDMSVVYVARAQVNLLQDPPDIDGAQGDLLYARELEPNGFISLNALANFYLDYRPERLAEAELLAHYAQNWARNDIEQAIALQTLGRIYLAKGLKADAEETFLQAMDLATVDGFVILTGLADDFMHSRE